MTRGATFDLEGRPVSKEEAAKALGFVNVEALEEYGRRREDETVKSLLADVCNLKQQVAELSSRLTATGTERIGGATCP